MYKNYIKPSLRFNFFFSLELLIFWREMLSPEFLQVIKSIG
jgi:hypothetical protein